MSKTFYTERDIDDLTRQGVRSLIVDDDVVLTDSAYERARKLGLELLRDVDQPPAAPIRPYIAKLASPSARHSHEAAAQAAPAVPAQPRTPTGGAATSDEIYQRVYTATVARLGDSVDAKLLDSIIRRVLKSVSTK